MPLQIQKKRTMAFVRAAVCFEQMRMLQSFNIMDISDCKQWLTETGPLTAGECRRTDKVQNFYIYIKYITLGKRRILCTYLSLWLLGTMSVKSSRVSSHVTSYIDTGVSRVLKADRQTGRVECLGSPWLLSPGPRPRETPGGSDGWRIATAPRRCWTSVCVGCPLDGGNWQAPRTLMETLEKEAALLEKRKRKAGWGSQA